LPTETYMKPDLKAVLAAMKTQQRQADPSSKALPFEPDNRAQSLEEAALDTPGPDGWVGWVLRSTTSGYQWARVCISAELLPFVVHGRIEPGDMRANVAAYIERDLLSDKLSDPTRWKP
jgi:hypothetical protein